MTHQPDQLPLLTMSDILWGWAAVRVLRPENYECHCCTKPSDAGIRATGTFMVGESTRIRETAVINLPCGCAAMGLVWWRAAPDVLARLVLVAEELIL